jgi:hypothetical protein
VQRFGSFAGVFSAFFATQKSCPSLAFFLNILFIKQYSCAVAPFGIVVQYVKEQLHNWRSGRKKKDGFQSLGLR